MIKLAGLLIFRMNDVPPPAEAFALTPEMPTNVVSGE